MPEKSNRIDTAERSVISQIHELHQLPLPALRKKWSDLFGRDPGRLPKNHLIRRLAYRIQELVYGGLSREAREQLRAWAESPEKMQKKMLREKIDLQPGTRLLRDWHGQRHEVIVADDGFLWDGKTYRSLSAVARAITGRHCGGRRFFGLQPSNSKGVGK